MDGYKIPYPYDILYKNSCENELNEIEQINVINNNVNVVGKLKIDKVENKATYKVDGFLQTFTTNSVYIYILSK